jgi:hypothetical protein
MKIEGIILNHVCEPCEEFENFHLKKIRKNRKDMINM